MEKWERVAKVTLLCCRFTVVEVSKDEVIFVLNSITNSTFF